MTSTRELVEDILQVTPMQHGMLFHAILGQQEQEYVQQLIFEVRGRLDVELLREAWTRTMASCQALRSHFVQTKDLPHPVQVIRRTVDVPFRHELPAEHGNAAQQLRALAISERFLVADAQSCPLFRLTLVGDPTGTQHLIWTFHHLILDGWSTASVLSEVSEHYQALRAGSKPAHFGRLRLRDHAAWVAARSTAPLEAFWASRLIRVEPRLAAAIAARSTSTDANGEHVATEHTLELNAPASRRLESLARESGVTLNALLSVLWGAFQARLQGTRSSAFGTTVSVRPPDLRGADTLVGLFLETVPMSVQLPEPESLSAWLQREGSECMRRQQAVGLSLSDMVELAGLPSAKHLFESLFVFENYPRGALPSADDTGLSLRLCEAFERTNYPLTVVVSPGERLELRVALTAEGASAAAACNIAQGYHDLLADIAATDLSDALRSYVEESVTEPLAEHGVAASIPADTLLHDLFFARARRHPAAVALELRETTLSYAELAAAAVRLAAELSLASVGPRDRVALVLGRSFELVVGMLATLEVGASWVPVDPSYPPDRIRFLLEDSGARVVLTGPGVELPTAAGSEVRIDVSQSLRATTRPNLAPSSSKTRQAPSDAAYMIYTSGSTGQPKGALISHAAAVNYLLHCEAEYGLAEGKRSAVFTSPSFDLTITSLWGPLTTGGTAVLVPEGSPQQVLEEASRLEEIHLLKLTPTHLELLRRLLPQPRLATLGRVLVVGGEALTPAAVVPWLAANRERIIVNEYGPTETTVGCCTESLTFADLPELEGARNVPIGTPIRNTRLTVRDADLQPVPTGSVGELFIGGAGLGLGYHARPELTAQRFVELPGEQGRFYRTGDRVRRLTDGRLEYLGRTDEQLKVRGYRIEPGEVEALLCAQARVSGAALTTFQLEGGAAELVACVTASGAQPLDLVALRTQLRGELPGYLLPQHVLEVKALPTTPNGKLDRHALPELARRTLEELGTLEAEPEGDLAEAAHDPWTRGLLRAFRRVSHNPGLSAEDDFFSNGGDSLRALSLLAAVDREIGLQVSLHDLYGARSVAGLLPLLGQVAAATPEEPSSAADTHSRLVVLRPGRRDRVWACVHPSGGEVYHYDALARALPAEDTVLGLRDLSLLGAPRAPSLDSLARDLLAQLSQLGGPVSLVGWSFGAIVALRMAALEGGTAFIERVVLLDPPDPARASVPSAHDLLLELLAQQGLLDRLPVSREALAQFSEARQLELVRAMLHRTADRRLRVSLDELRLRVGLVQHHARLLGEFCPSRVAPPVWSVLANDSLRSAKPLYARSDESLRALTHPPTFLTHMLGGGPVRAFVAPGDHYDLMRRPVSQALGELFARLSRERAEPSSEAVA